MKHSPILLFGVFLALPLLSSVLAYNEDTCCELAKKQNAFIGEVPPPEDQECGQTYSPGLPAAKPLWVDYRFCSSECKEFSGSLRVIPIPQILADRHLPGRGMGLSKASQPSQWAAPIVEFILPSVIFSMTIPRRKKIDFDYLLDFKLRTGLHRVHPWLDAVARRIVYLALFVFILISVFFDTMIWISIIVVGAGSMIISGILEAHLDYQVVRYCKSKVNNDEKDLRMKRELLTTIIAGNLQLGKGDPQQIIPRSLMLHDSDSPTSSQEASMSRLLNLLDAQASFGGAVGSPVLFFLGGFFYTILDLKQNPSSEDSAISLGFGIEWMNIVNVAIVSGCLLASNNPSTSAGIAGAKHEALESHEQSEAPSKMMGNLRDGDSKQLDSQKWNRKDYSHHLLGWSDAYETEFQPVSFWARGTNKMKWIRKSEAWRSDPEFQKIVKITWLGWIFKIFTPTFLLVSLPPAAGSVLAYYFPPRGLGCRSLGFMIYGLSQALISGISVAHNAAEVNGELFKVGWHIRALYVFLWSISFFAAIGGTTMQVVGVSRNCICASLARYWVNIRRQNPAINLATDTQAARDASDYWITMGTIASIFVGFVTVIAWWYQKIVRHRFTQAVRNLHIPSNIPLAVSVTTTKSADSTPDRFVEKNGVYSLEGDASRPIDFTKLPLGTVSPTWDSSSRTRWSSLSAEPLIEGYGRRESIVKMSPLP